MISAFAARAYGCTAACWLALLFLCTGELRAAVDSKPSVTVAAEGKADFHTVQEAIDHAPPTGEIIRLAPGRYREKLHINTPEITLLGTGKRPEDVVLSWNDAASNAGGTGKSGSVSVNADGFEAENLTIENTWELE